MTQSIDPLYAPAYSHREAVRLTGLAYGTLYAWTHGKQPIIRLAERRKGVSFWSFTNIVEAKVLRSMRNRNLRTDAIRKAVRYVEVKLDQKHPLALEAFKTDGVELFVERYGALINASQDGQIAIREAVEQYLKHVVYEEGRAVRLFLDDSRTVVIDPRRGFGRPIIEGTRIPVAVIGKRFFEHNETLDELAADFELDRRVVERAIQTIGKSALSRAA